MVQWTVISSGDFSSKKIETKKKSLLRQRWSVDEHFHVNLIAEKNLEAYFLILCWEKLKNTEGQLRVLIKMKNAEILRLQEATK